MKQIWIYVKRNLVYPRVCLDSKNSSYMFVCSFDINIPDNAHYITDECIRTKICCMSMILHLLTHWYILRWYYSVNVEYHGGIKSDKK